MDTAVAVWFWADFRGEGRGWGDVRATFARGEGDMQVGGMDWVGVWVEDFLRVDRGAVKRGGAGACRGEGLVGLIRTHFGMTYSMSSLWTGGCDAGKEKFRLETTPEMQKSGEGEVL